MTTPDVMAWLQSAAELLTCGAQDPCAAHAEHATTVMRCDLSGHGLDDWPRADLAFDLAVFDAERYRDTPGFCPADSDVSRTLVRYGCWEAWESLLALAILRDGDGPVVDFGANVGWYSVLALAYGHDLLAVESEPSTAAVLAANLMLAREQFRTGAYAGVAYGWVGPDTPMLPSGPCLRLVKVDIEGAEAHAVAALLPSLDAGLVDFLLVEHTPEFGDGGRIAWDLLARHRYVPYAVPDKGADVAVYETDPLGSTIAAGPMPGLGVEQANVLWVGP